MAGEISLATRTEVLVAIRSRYGEASKKDKSRMLDEFVATTGCHRKHLVRLLERGGNGSARAVPRGRKQERPLDADALAAIRATALSPRGLRGGSFERNLVNARIPDDGFSPFIGGYRNTRFTHDENGAVIYEVGLDHIPAAR